MFRKSFAYHQLFFVDVSWPYLFFYEDRWMYDNIMSEEVEMNDENKHQATVNEEQHVDCSDVFNTSQVIIRFIVIKLLK